MQMLSIVDHRARGCCPASPKLSFHLRSWIHNADFDFHSGADDQNLRELFSSFFLRFFLRQSREAETPRHQHLYIKTPLWRRMPVDSGLKIRTEILTPNINEQYTSSLTTAPFPPQNPHTTHFSAIC